MNKYVKTFESFYNEIELKHYGKDKYRIFYNNEVIGYIQYRIFNPFCYSIEFIKIKDEFKNKGLGSKSYIIFKDIVNAKKIVADVYSIQSLKAILKAYGEPTTINDQPFTTEELNKQIKFINNILSKDYLNDFYITLEFNF